MMEGAVEHIGEGQREDNENLFKKRLTCRSDRFGQMHCGSGLDPRSQAAWKMPYAAAYDLHVQGQAAKMTLLHYGAPDTRA